MPHNRLVINGTLGQGAEIWSTGIAYQGSLGTPGIDTPEGLVEWSEQAFLALLGRLGSTNPLALQMSTTARIDSVSAYWYPAFGDAGAVGEYVPVTPITGSGALTKPFQTSVCLSSRTALPGRSFRGRNYWPSLGGTVGSDGRLSAGTTAALAEEWSYVLDALAGAAPGVLGLQPVIASPTLQVVTPVTSILCGNVLDTQRRRRNGLQEAYASHPYPPEEPPG